MLLRFPLAPQLPSLEHSICPSPWGEKDRHRDKDRNDLASPRNPSLEKVMGPQDFLAKTWASAWTQLERQEPKRLAFPDPETSNFMGLRECPPGGCPH